MTNYYTLIAKMPEGVWAPQFGDYDKSTVDYEMRDYKESGNWEKGTQFKIIKTEPEQEMINDHIAGLNAGA
jgi:hypothetical protein